MFGLRHTLLYLCIVIKNKTFSNTNTYNIMKVSEITPIFINEISSLALSTKPKNSKQYEAAVKIEVEKFGLSYSQFNLYCKKNFSL